MHKILMISIVYLFVYNISIAQHKLFFGASTNRNGFKTDKLNSFIGTFNDFHQATGFTAFDDFTPHVQSIAGNIGYRYLSPLSLSFSGQYALGWGKQNNQTTLARKSGYELTHRMKNNDVWFEVGYFTGRLNLSGVLGLNQSTNSVEIFKVYANGDRSMGYEDDLPGHYEAKSFNADIGASLGFKLWHFYVPVRVTYGIPLYKEGTVLTDYDTYRFRSNELPQDYAKWIQDANKYDPENNIGQNEFAGVRLHIGLEFMIPLGK